MLYVLLSLICWVAIYPLDGVIHPLYKWALTDKTEANLIWKAKPIGYRPVSSWWVSYRTQSIHWSYQCAFSFRYCRRLVGKQTILFFRFIGRKKWSAGFFTNITPSSGARCGGIPTRWEGDTLRLALILSSDMAFYGGRLNFRLF